jgi:hypothetical protein
MPASLGDASYVDLLDEARYHAFLANPGLFGAEIRALAGGSWVVVDEIQRLPRLLHEAHPGRPAKRQQRKSISCSLVARSGSPSRSGRSHNSRIACKRESSGRSNGAKPWQRDHTRCAPPTWSRRADQETRKRNQLSLSVAVTTDGSCVGNRSF